MKTSPRQAVLPRLRPYLKPAVGLAIAVNVLVAAAYLWSRGGATTHLRIEAKGDQFRAFVDGRLQVQAKLEAPQTGGITLILEDTDSVPSLPKPRGVSHVRVTDDRGEGPARGRLPSAANQRPGLDAAGRTRVRNEARAMARLGDHPNIFCQEFDFLAKVRSLRMSDEGQDAVTESPLVIGAERARSAPGGDT
jgi:hypothetical protein